MDGSPLRRSGLNVHELFNAPDQVVVRSRTPAVALELGLEHARGALVRNQPADALATLDQVWSGARHTETGWYLRGGSLALLGLPGEASRVANEALLANPQSAANHFLQSLAQLTLGDLQAAQLSLANAEANSEPEALLLIQHALIEAQRGNVGAAEEMLHRAASSWPDHPALIYGRDMMREVLRTSARERQRTPVRLSNFPVNESPVRTPSSSRTPVSTSVLFANSRPSETESRAHARDLAADAFGELGTQLSSGTRRQALAESRQLLGSLSSGGVLSNAMPAARAHAARAVIGAVIEALNGNTISDAVGWDAESVDGQWQRAHEASTKSDNANTNSALHTATRALVIALTEGRIADADLQLRRARGSLGESTFTLLRSLLNATNQSDDWNVDEAHLQSRDAQSHTAQAAYENVGSRVYDAFVGHTLLAPLRLGLALLPEDELSRHEMRMPSDANETVTYAGSMAGRVFGDESRNVLRPLGSTGTFVGAISLIALAVLAFSAGHPMVAIILGATGGWLALRRGSQGARL